MRGRNRSRVPALFLGVLMTATVAFFLPAGPALAVGENASATGAIIGGGRTAPIDCPPGGAPVSALGVTSGVLTVGALTAACTDTSASASAASVTIAGLQIGAVQSQCTSAGGSSSVAVINGLGLVSNGTITTPLTITLPLVATITFNEVVTSGGFVTVNALHINLLGSVGSSGVDVIVAQSRCKVGYPLAVGSAKASFGGSAVPVVAQGSSSPTRPPAWLVVAAVLSCLVVAQFFFAGDVLSRRRSARG